jgi:hypothetical protein
LTPPSLESALLLLDEGEVSLWAGEHDGAAAWFWVVDPAGAGPAAVAAARRDLAALATWQHPSLIDVQAVDTLVDGRLAVRLAPWEGRSLAERLARGEPLPAPVLLAVAEAVCSALAALHRRGIVHGGLAPAHVWIAEPGPTRDRIEVRVSGAGWAGLHQAWAGRFDARPERLIRQPPEVVYGEAPGPERQADVFAVGCLLYEALTGHPAFGGGSADEVRKRLTSHERPSLRPHLGRSEDPLDRIVGRCLDRSPAARYSSATALWRELAPALGGHAVPLHTDGTALPSAEPVPEAAAAPVAREPAPEPPEPTARLAPRRPRYRTPVLVTAALTVLAAAVAGWLLWHFRADEGPAAAAPPRSSPATEALDGPDAGKVVSARPPPDAAPRSEDAAVRPPVGNPRQAVIDGLLGAVGLTAPLLVATERARRTWQLARAAMHDGDDAAFDRAVRRFADAVAPRRCRELREQLRLYVVAGIRRLGPRYLPRAERTRIEQGLVAVGGMKDTPCAEQNRMLAPLVTEIRERIEKKHAPRVAGAPSPG